MDGGLARGNDREQAGRVQTHGTQDTPVARASPQEDLPDAALEVRAHPAISNQINGLPSAA